MIALTQLLQSKGIDGIKIVKRTTEEMLEFYQRI
jgi:hypothetical protein